MELIYRENNDPKSTEVEKIRTLKDTVETELKNLHKVLHEITQSVNNSQDTMERCIYYGDSQLDGDNANDPWEQDTLDEENQYSYDKLEQLTTHYSDTEDVTPSSSVNPVQNDSKITKKKSSDLNVSEKKRFKRSKSAKKIKITQSTSSPVIKRQISDAELKNELHLMDKEQLLELALKLKDEESDENTVSSSHKVEITQEPPKTPSAGGMNKKLKHRIPSKTRLRIAPLASSSTLD